MVKNPPAKQETWVRSLGWEDPLEKEMAAHSSSLSWKSHRQRSPAGSSPWGHDELGMIGKGQKGTLSRVKSSGEKQWTEMRMVCLESREYWE